MCPRRLKALCGLSCKPIIGTLPRKTCTALPAQRLAKIAYERQTPVRITNQLPRCSQGFHSKADLVNTCLISFISELMQLCLAGLDPSAAACTVDLAPEGPSHVNHHYRNLTGCMQCCAALARRSGSQGCGDPQLRESRSRSSACCSGELHCY
jgi:hypothetical protein